MTVESNGHSGNGSGGNGGPILRAVLDGLQTGKTQELIAAIKNNASTPPEFQAVVDQANLRPEQTAILNLLMALQGAPGAASGRAEEIESTEPQVPDQRTRRRRLQHIKRELDDLREVNDTVAAALGACRVCWGGDEECDECEGSGRPGSCPPDPALFEKLVAPAIRRIRTIRGSPDKRYLRARR